MAGKASGLTLQNDIVLQLLANGWPLGKPENYNHELAYEEGLRGFVIETQDAQWQKLSKRYLSIPIRSSLSGLLTSLKDLVGLLHSTHRCRRYAGLAQLDQLHNPLSLRRA
jgi:hypothetical protein